MAIAFALIYLAGILGALAVDRHRAGIGQIGRIPVSTLLLSPAWFGFGVLHMIFWPVFLTMWFVQGRPESPWETVSTSGGAVRVRRRQVT